MDILQLEKYQIKINCYKHPNNKVLFIQTKEIKSDKDLFYCQLCAYDDDQHFKISNYLLLDKIEVQNDTQIIDRWPPLQDNSLYNKLQQFSLKNNNTSQQSQNIETFFENMKLEIIKKIDQVKKATINKLQSFPIDSSQIQKKYEELSKTKLLKTILVDANINCEQKQNRFRNLIQELESQKQNNTQMLNQLIQKYQQNQIQIDFESSNKVKSYIMELIDQINIFAPKTNINQLINNIQFEDNQINTKLIFDLISTKSNYCSEMFLSQIKSFLIQISPIIEKQTIQDIFIKDKKPINFSKLNNSQLDLMNNFCEHLTRMQSKSEQELKEMINIGEIKQIMSVVALKSNYLKQDFQKQFEKYLIETYIPFNKLNFDTIFQQNQKIEVFQKIYDETLDNIVELTQKINEVQNKENVQKERIKEYCNNFEKWYYQHQNSNKLEQMYAIQNSVNSHKQIDILPQMQFMKTNWRQSQQLQIEKNKQNNQISISLSQNTFYTTNCVSDLIFDKNRSYVFRFQFINNSQQSKHLFIGLLRDSQKDSNYGFQDKLSCCLKINQNSLEYGGINYGIDKKEKGDGVFVGSQEIEMRVCISDEILQILDYPNYNHILSLQDQYKKNLKEYQNLILYIGFAYKDIKIQIIHALQNQ